MGDAEPLLSENDVEGEEKKPKRRKPGIVYLSSIPPNMNVSQIRQYFSNYGALDRVFLQAVDKGSHHTVCLTLYSMRSFCGLS